MKTPHRIMLVRGDRLGDVVISSACLRVLRESRPEMEIHWAVSEAWVPLFHLPDIQILPLPRKVSGQNLLELWREIRTRRIDTWLNLQPERRLDLAAALARVQTRAGFRRRRCWPQALTLDYPYQKSLGERHEVAYAGEILAALDVAMPLKPKPWLVPDISAKTRVESRMQAAFAGKRYAVIHLTAHGNKPRVPWQVWHLLVEHLQKRHSLQVIVVGEEKDEVLNFTTQVLDGRQQFDVAELAWLLAGAVFFAGRDSGPAHLAAAMGCPTLTLFVDRRPIMGVRRWRPLGLRVETVERSQGSDVAPEFDPTLVIAAAERLL